MAIKIFDIGSCSVIFKFVGKKWCGSRGVGVVGVVVVVCLLGSLDRPWLGQVTSGKAGCHGGLSPWAAQAARQNKCVSSSAAQSPEKWTHYKGMIAKCTPGGASLWWK